MDPNVAVVTLDCILVTDARVAARTTREVVIVYSFGLVSGFLGFGLLLWTGTGPGFTSISPTRRRRAAK